MFTFVYEILSGLYKPCHESYWLIAFEIWTALTSWNYLHVCQFLASDTKLRRSKLEADKNRYEILRLWVSLSLKLSILLTTPNKSTNLDIWEENVVIALHAVCVAVHCILLYPIYFLRRKWHRDQPIRTIICTQQWRCQKEVTHHAYLLASIPLVLYVSINCFRNQ